jgi:RNA polymerase sigma-70 factor, ECF subfamily
MYSGEQRAPIEGAYFYEEQPEPITQEPADLEAGADQFLAEHDTDVADTTENTAGDDTTPEDAKVIQDTLQPAPKERVEIDPAIIDKAVAGDASAIEHITLQIHPMIVRYTRGKLGRGHNNFMDADDVAQEIMLATLNALPKFLNDGRSFIGYMYGIAGHKVTDQFRAKGRNLSDPQEEIEIGDTSDSPENTVLGLQTNQTLLGALDRLSPQQREVVTLRIVNGLSAEEVAQIVDSTPGAVRVSQHRALGKMRTFFGENATFNSVFTELTEEDAETETPAPKAKAGPKPALTPIAAIREPHQEQAVESIVQEPETTEETPLLVTVTAKQYAQERPRDSTSAAYAAARYLCRMLSAEEAGEHLGGIRPHHVELYYGDHNPLMGRIIERAGRELAH